MPHSDRRTDVSPGQAAVRHAGPATPAGNRSRHWVTGADAGAVDDWQLRGWLAVVAGGSRTPSSPPMASSTAAACRGCPDGAGHGKPPAASALVPGGRGMAFLLTMALGYLPVLPAPGDIACCSRLCRPG